MKLNFQAAHKRLWKWCMENPGKSKIDWPEWVHNKGKIPKVCAYCFPCEAAHQLSAPELNGCKVCPIGNCDIYKVGEITQTIRTAKILMNQPWTGRKVYEI